MILSVNPMHVRRGDKLVTHGASFSNGTSKAVKTRTVANVGICGTNANCFHIDHECYDTRFSSVKVVR